MKPAVGCWLRFYAHSLLQLLGENGAFVPPSAFSIDDVSCVVFCVECCPCHHLRSCLFDWFYMLFVAGLGGRHCVRLHSAAWSKFATDCRSGS